MSVQFSEPFFVNTGATAFSYTWSVPLSTVAATRAGAQLGCIGETVEDDAPTLVGLLLKTVAKLGVGVNLTATMLRPILAKAAHPLGVAVVAAFVVGAHRKSINVPPRVKPCGFRESRDTMSRGDPA